MVKLAKEHSLDIPHVTAVELPLVVKNPDKAITMLGGKERVSKVLNSNNRGIDLLTKEEPLELRLRNNRFHHPIQSATNTREKILLKVSVPKKNLPQDFQDMPLKDILKHNETQGGRYTMEPVGIINQTYSFKGMNDFQVNTKHNKVVNEINDNLVGVLNYDQLKTYFDPKKFINNDDFKDPGEYDNKDHQLPPPPVLSPIKYPFDYQYEKNPISITVKDPKSGDLKVISKKATVKLHTFMVDFRDESFPERPSDELIKNFELLGQSNLTPSTYNYDLFGCIRWLITLFDVKPIWLRKHIEDLVPDDFRRVLKQALPYVTYIFKNGPWRFCNVKYGVNPKLNQKYWIYQSEYFRLSNISIKDVAEISGEKVVSKTVALNNNNDLKISSELIFLGIKLPSTVTFQIGDISDVDVAEIIEQAGSDMFRDTIDFQDGWVQKQVIEPIRRVVKYKLNQLVKNQLIDDVKVEKIKNAAYTDDNINDDDMEIDKDSEAGESDTEESEPEDDEIEVEEEAEPEAEAEAEQAVKMEVDDDGLGSESEQTLLSKLHNVDPMAAKRLESIVSLIKQESLM